MYMLENILKLLIHISKIFLSLSILFTFVLMFFYSILKLIFYHLIYNNEFNWNLIFLTPVTITAIIIICNKFNWKKMIIWDDKY